MALANVGDVRRRGSLQTPDAYTLFDLEDEGALDDLLKEDLDLAAAWLGERVDDAYYTGAATANTNRDLLFKRAEILVTLHFATLPLKIRKVEGTQWPLLQEDSSRFAELIDVEYLRQAELLIQPYVDIETAGEAPFALPAILATNDFERSELLDRVTQNQALIDESLGLTGVTE